MTTTSAEPAGPSGSARTLKAPTATPGAVFITSLFAIALLAVAGIAIRDFIIEMKWISGEEWIAVASRWIADLSWQVWMWPAGIALIIVGLYLLWTSVRPRTKTHLPVAGAHGVDGYAPSTWTRRVDLARRSSAVAREVAGVLDTETVVTRRAIKVRITAVDDLDRLASTVRDLVTAAAAPVAPDRKVVVKTRQKKIDEARTPPPPISRPALPVDPDAEPVTTQLTKTQAAESEEEKS